MRSSPLLLWYRSGEGWSPCVFPEESDLLLRIVIEDSSLSAINQAVVLRHPQMDHRASEDIRPTKCHILVAFGVWPVMVCPFNQGHTSSGVQVQGHEVEQVLGG